jgi:hypothetical protein
MGWTSKNGNFQVLQRLRWVSKPMGGGGVIMGSYLLSCKCFSTHQSVVPHVGSTRAGAGGRHVAYSKRSLHHIRRDPEYARPTSGVSVAIRPLLGKSSDGCMGPHDLSRWLGQQFDSGS